MFWRILSVFLILSFTFIYAADKGCDSTCKTCNLFYDSAACTSCNGTLQVLVNNDYGTCVNKTCSELNGLELKDSSGTKCFIGGSCPNGYYASQGSCVACDSSCVDCIAGGKEDCLSCPSGKTLNLGDKEFSGSCIDSTACTNNGTLFGDKAVCGKNGTCDTSCATCLGPLAAHCTSCKDANNVLNIENIVSGISWGTCSATVNLKRKYYNFGMNPSSTKAQYKCHWTCKGCVAENDRFACTACAAGTYLNILSELNGAPVGNCKPECEGNDVRTFTAGTSQFCTSNTGSCPFNSTGKIGYANGACTSNIQCAQGCGVCSDSAADQCLYCSSQDSWLKLTTNLTSGTCGAYDATLNFTAYGKYASFPGTCQSPYTNVENRMCTVSNCTVANCEVCGTDPNTCWKCKQGFLIQSTDKSHIEGTCVATCPTGYAMSSTTGRCLKCHKNCATCDEGLVPNKCRTCAGKLLLVENAPAACVENCAFGMTSSNGVCVSGGSNPEPNPNPNPTPNPVDEGSTKTPGWYVAAIIIGIFSMLGFIGFMIYIVIDFMKNSPPAEAQSAKEPQPNLQPPLPPQPASSVVQEKPSVPPQPVPQEPVPAQQPPVENKV